MNLISNFKGEGQYKGNLAVECYLIAGKEVLKMGEEELILAVWHGLIARPGRSQNGFSLFSRRQNVY
ncbi:MAG: hypothetical protein M1379_15770 [Firmicutes bacterium]|nr:hypothetical protein [Bacillota bacterium]